jgi:hypothetical protein
MKYGVRIALSVYIGFFFYSILVFAFGPSGLLAFQHMMRHSASLVANIGELEQIGGELAQHRDLLLSDTEELMLLGRTLGYYRNDEVRVLLPEAGGSGIRHVIGRMVSRYRSSDRDQTLFRAIGFVVTIASFLAVTIVFGRRNGNSAG